MRSLILFQPLRKYFSYFRIRFNTGIQYRTAAISGLVTQFFWGIFNVLLYKAFWEGDPLAFPMGIAEATTYVWLRQAFLAQFNQYTFEESIFSDITSGNVAYDLARPVDIYSVWYSKLISMKVSNTLLRFAPIIIFSLLLPAPYGLSLPYSFSSFMAFLITMLLALLNLCALQMIIYALTFHTLNSNGMRVIFVSIGELLSGDLIPIPFFPEKIRIFIELSPFAAMSNVPFRVYSGNIRGGEILICMLLQLFWLCVLFITGRLLTTRSLKKVVIQGG